MQTRDFWARHWSRHEHTDDLREVGVVLDKLKRGPISDDDSARLVSSMIQATTGCVGLLTMVEHIVSK